MGKLKCGEVVMVLYNLKNPTSLKKKTKIELITKHFCTRMIKIISILCIGSK